MPNNVYININTQASVALINKLELLHRSAMPLTIRGTLNAAAFDVKTKTLDESAHQNFLLRQPTFFKKFSGVNRATGFDINSMKASVGMTSDVPGGDKAQTAVANTAKQEEGGKVSDGLDYLAAARTGTSLDRTVAGKRRFKASNTVKGAYSRKGGTTKSRTVAAAYVALNTGKFQKLRINGRNFYRQVTSISKTTKGKIKIKSKLVYVSRSGSIKPLQATHFNREAAERTQPKIPGFFNKEGQKQINRLWK